MERKKKHEPSDKKLYARVLKKVKERSKVWPSAYASGQVVQEYKRRGGTYSSFGELTGLARWFK